MDVVCKTVCLLCTITLTTGQFFTGVRIHFYQSFELVQMSLCTFIEIYYLKNVELPHIFFVLKIANLSICFEINNSLDTLYVHIVIS